MIKENILTTTNPIIQTKVRYDELDAFRLFAAICVVIIHITASAMVKFQTGSSLQYAITAINGLALFAVPAFIAISGLTIHLSYLKKTLKLTEFFKKRMLTLAVPYVLWTLIYYFDQLHFSQAVFSLKAFLMHLLLGTAFYHLYFMPIIFQFYLLYPLFNWLSKKVKPSILLMLSLVLFVLYIGNGLTVMSQWHLPWPIKAEIPYSDRFFMSYLPFYALGLALAQSYTLFESRIKYILAISIPVYLVSEYSHLLGRIDYFVYQKNPPWQLPLAWEISSFFAIVLLIALFGYFRKHSLIPHLVKTLSGLTFTLYLAHPLILQICEIKLSFLATKSLTLFYAITFILCISLPLIFAYGINRIKQKWLN